MNWFQKVLAFFGLYNPPTLEQILEKVDTPVVIAIPPKPVVTPVNSSEWVKGLDVARYQNTMDASEWKKAWDLGYRFAFAKATDGALGKDSFYTTHRKLAKEAGFIFGSYHFFRFNQPLEGQVQNFIATTKGVLTGELPLSLDCEWDNSTDGKATYGDGKEIGPAGSDRFYEFASRVENLSGMTPIIYTHPYFFRGFKNTERFARFIPWITRPGKVEPVTPSPWKQWVFWQDSFKLSIGDVKEIDTNVYRGNLDMLKAMAKK